MNVDDTIRTAHLVFHDKHLSDLADLEVHDVHTIWQVLEILNNPYLHNLNCDNS